MFMIYPYTRFNVYVSIKGQLIAQPPLP